MNKDNIKKVVLAYSGGLDTSIIIPWLKENYNNPEIIAVAGNVGQADELDGLEEKAIKTGASKLIVADLTDEMVDDVIIPALKMDAKYESYLLGTAFARPIIGKALAKIALEEGADAIVHGCTGKGNDQVRFETTIKALNPAIKIIAPWRTWNFHSREDLIEYAKSHDIPIHQTVEKIYSRDENIWHISHEGGNLENPWNEHKPDIHVLSCPIEDAPDEVEYVDIDFEQGIPVGLNGEKMDSVTLLNKLNELGSKHGIGTIDIIENRLVGMKSRGVYETPGGTILYSAHAALERLVLDRDTMQYKNIVAQKFSQIIYDGLWFTPLREAISAFVDKTQEQITGTVKMKLYKGNAIAAASKSIYSLYSEEYATFSADEVYNQHDAEGFINLFSLPLKIRAIQKEQREGGSKYSDKLEMKVVKGIDFIQ